MPSSRSERNYRLEGAALRNACQNLRSDVGLDFALSNVDHFRFAAQRSRSLAKGLWMKSYAGSNVDEFFAELTMWYFGTHGDTGMTGPKPENGAEGLKNYDPEAYALMDDFYSGRIVVGKVEPRRGRSSEPFRKNPEREGSQTHFLRRSYRSDRVWRLLAYRK